MKGIDFNIYKLDFFILDNNDPKTILLLDRSNYIFPPENPRLFITPPGLTGEIIVEYEGVKNSLIEINSEVLGFTENCSTDSEYANLEDGVYQIKMATCPYEELYVKKCYLKTTLLDCRIEELLLKYDDCGCVKDDLFKNTIIDIDILLKSARAEVNICNVEKATLKFRKAIKMVDFLDKQLNCK